MNRGRKHVTGVGRAATRAPRAGCVHTLCLVSVRRAQVTQEARRIPVLIDRALRNRAGVMNAQARRGKTAQRVVSVATGTQRTNVRLRHAS